MKKPLLSLLSVGTLLFSVGVYAGDQLCPTEVTFEDANKHAADQPINLMVKEGEFKGQTVPACFEKGKAFKDLKVGDALAAHGEVHRISELGKTNSTHRLVLK